MSRMIAALSLALLAGCATTTSAPKPVAAATDAQRAALIERVKGLEGRWDASSSEGMSGEVTFAVTSNGSAVRETMFPGSPNEMVNMYTMDGPTMVMTHYCAIGNQPHMRAAAASGNCIDLKSDGVSNLESADQMYMGHMMLTIVDKDHAEEGWTSYVNGKEAEHHAQFKLTRKK